jgi:plasmid stabilization system protein ParE
MKVTYSDTALRELNEIFAYIHERNRNAATAVVDHIERLTSLIGEIPLIGRRTDEEGVRMIPVVRFPFLIFYTVNDSKVKPADGAGGDQPGPIVVVNL